MTESGRRTAAAIASAQFDDRSFSLSDIDGRPIVVFTVPGRGEGRVGDGVELDPITGPNARWWTEVHEGRPSTDTDGTDRWTQPGYTVIARYDSAGEIAAVSLADSAHHEWPLTSVTAPLHRIEWLDRPPISAAERRQLTEAFNAAALYDEGARVAVWPPRRRFTIGHELAHWVMHRTGQQALFCRRTTVDEAGTRQHIEVLDHCRQ